MAKRRKKPSKKSKAKKPSKKKTKHTAKKGGSGGAKGKTGKPPKSKTAGWAKKSMTVAELGRELKKISAILATLNAYFAKFPGAPAVSERVGVTPINPTAEGGECVTRISGGPGALQVIGDQCAPPVVPLGGDPWSVFKVSLARMSATVTTLIGMLAGMDPAKKI